MGHTGGIQFTIGGPSGVLPEHPYDLMLKTNYSYPAMGGCPKNAGSKTINGKYRTYLFVDILISHFHLQKLLKMILRARYPMTPIIVLIISIML